jgi:hypothetical protein
MPINEQIEAAMMPPLVFGADRADQRIYGTAKKPQKPSIPRIAAAPPNEWGITPSSAAMIVSPKNLADEPIDLVAGKITGNAAADANARPPAQPAAGNLLGSALKCPSANKHRLQEEHSDKPEIGIAHHAGKRPVFAHEDLHQISHCWREIFLRRGGNFRDARLDSSPQQASASSAKAANLCPGSVLRRPAATFH